MIFNFLVGFLLCFLISGASYSQIFNYNNHSYYFSSRTTNGYWLDNVCGYDKHYSVDIQDSEENKVIFSFLRNNRLIGIGKYYGYNEYSTLHTDKKLSYNNFGSKPGYYNTRALINEVNGKWTGVSQWYQYLYICEDDSISSNGVNVTGDKFINIKYDDLLTFRGHSYYIYKVYRDYENILQICKNDHNGYIFIPNDGLENCAINSKNHGFIYVGITNIKKTFMTVKGYQASYLPWLPGQPQKELCVIRSHIHGEFKTQECTAKKHIICETDTVVKDAVPANCSYERKQRYFAQIIQYETYSIRIFDFEANQTEAKTLCSRRGDVLFVPRNSLENCAVMENSEFTIGLNYGVFYVKHLLVRGDGFKDKYTNWASGYPDSNSDKECVYAQYDSGKWKNDVCKPSTFACRENNRGRPSTINCSTDYYEKPITAYSFTLGSSVYSLFGGLLGYHDSARLCAYYGQTLIKDTDSYTFEKINKYLINVSFHIDYRILWNDTKFTWLDNTPSNTPNWAPGEPKSDDFLISCVAILPNQTWITDSCKNTKVAVCVGDNVPTMTSTTSKFSSTTTSTSTTTTTTTTQPSTVTTTQTSSSSSTGNISASKKSNSVALGVGLFFAVIAAGLIAVGVYIYKKRGYSFSAPLSLRSFGSFRTRSFDH